jgi:UDP-N-acetylglucosamine--N-acetylmuramyl-(pentapeptide) pyrophosphoryl-undecaprenol N-acetylglucosamine transferase
MKVLVTGGGTGGHIYPGLAFIGELQTRIPEVEILYVGTKKGMEADIVSKENITFAAIHSRGFRRKISLNTLKTIWVAGQGVFEAKRIIENFHPDLVVGTGGYVAGPMVLQAALKRVPTLIHEQNALPSVTNRLLARFVTAIAVSFQQSIPYFPSGKPIFVTGNPVRREILQLSREDALQKLGLTKDNKTILIVGGSNGAEPINNAVMKLIQGLQEEKLQFIFVTGKRNFDQVQDYIRTNKIEIKEGNKVIPYLYDMPAGLKAADLIISRAGGMIAEINACGLPAIYIPSPYVADNHQEFNAKAIESQGAAIMLREKELTSEVLWKMIQELVFQPQRLEQMKQAAFALAKPKATQEMVDIALQLIRNESPMSKL